MLSSQFLTNITECNSTDLKLQLAGTTKLRKVLAKENPPLRQVADCGIIPRLVKFLSSSNLALQKEASWTITNLLSGGTQVTKRVLEAGAVPVLKRLLVSPHPDIAEQAVWAIANIAGDSPPLRDYILKTGSLSILLQICKPTPGRRPAIPLLRLAVWALANMCRGTPRPPFAIVGATIPCFSWILKNCDDAEVCTDVLWALSYLTDDHTDGNLQIRAVLASSVLSHVVKFLAPHLGECRVPALRTVGNISTGTDHQTEELLDSGVLPYLVNLLSDHKAAVRKEAAWTMSNIMAGTEKQVARCVAANSVTPLVELLNNGTFYVRKEACWALSNLTSKSSGSVRQKLLFCGLVEGFCEILLCDCAEIVCVALDGLQNLLNFARRLSCSDNVCVNQIEECGGLVKIESLQKHSNESVYHKSFKIMKEFFNQKQPTPTAPLNSVLGFGVPKSSRLKFNF